MVLESAEAVAEFLMNKYLKSRERYGNVFRHPKDVHDVEFPAFVADNATKIRDLALRLKRAFPHIPEEEHVLLAYLLHVYARGEDPTYAPHRRVISAPRKFFMEYARKALGNEKFEAIRVENKYRGIAVGQVLERVPDHNLPRHVVEKRFTFR